VREGDEVVPDPDGRAPGRGAYLCADDQDCMRLAARRGGFKRSFRAPVEVPPTPEYT
jgi:predicted RNA-binding protein YlxR (DUF448 family)